MGESAFTAEHREWLAANKYRDRDRWLYSDNSKPIIDELEALGIMRAVSEEFGPPVDTDQAIILIGKPLPVFTVASLYMLTPYGQHLLEEAQP